MRRMHKDSVIQEAPRRIPEFPRPPENRFAPLESDGEDIVSNPSDEGRLVMSAPIHQYPAPLMDVTNRSSRPLPPVPHSRDPSNQFSYYGSLPSHSRGPSDQMSVGQPNVPGSRPDSAHHTKTPSVSSSVKKELNPFAKPFVFGNRPVFVAAPASVAASVYSESVSSPIQVNAPTHSRGPSGGTSRMLNAAAQEFKPGGFTFRPPEGVPKLQFPEPLQDGRPLPETPIIGLSHTTQGREKRQRISLSPESSDAESEGEHVQNSMASFRFPTHEGASSFIRSAPTSPNRPPSSLNASAKPFTFSGFSNMPPVLPPLLGQEQRSLADTINASELLSITATRGSVLIEDNKSPELTLPSMQKQKRAPIPLDFKHPVSTNMVPAGLFKNLASADADDRARSSRAQAGSLDFSDVHSDVSLDDMAMPAISRSRRMPKPEDLDMTDDEFDRVSEDAVSRGRRTSDATHPGSIGSRMSATGDATSYSKGLHLAERLEGLLEQKMEQLRNDLTLRFGGGGFISESTEELVKEAMAMFRTQLHDSAIKGLEDNSMDAGRELDFEVIREIVEQGHEETRRNIQDDLASILKNIKDSEGAAMPESILDLIRTVQELRTSVFTSSAHISERLSAIETLGPNAEGFRQEREALVIDMLAALAPHLSAVRSEPIDYDGLTMKLSQAVKPHITQLIDLASDKRETAGIITDNLMPVLQSIAANPSLDTASLLSEITATVSRIISPIDTHNIKEQVADLVVERLDSRLATRDNDTEIKFETLRQRVSEALNPVLGRVDVLGENIVSVKSGQSIFSEKAAEIASKQSDLDKGLLTLVEKVSSVVEVMNLIKGLVSQQEQLYKQGGTQLTSIESSLSKITSSWQGLSKEKEEISEISKKLLSEFSSVPESITNALSSYETKQDDILDRLKSINDATQEVRKLSSQNSELQTQLNKARGQHGQVRVQNDVLSQKLSSAEIERDQLRHKVEELQAAVIVHVAEFATLESRNKEQELAMHTALDRLKISDINAQAQQERISELERANREFSREVADLRSKVRLSFVRNKLVFLYFLVDWQVGDTSNIH